MSVKLREKFVTNPTIIDDPTKVILDPYTVQFGSSRINYNDLVSVLYNTSADDAAVVVLSVRSSSNSLVSGLPQYELLEFDFKNEAKPKITGFIEKVRELNIPLSETAYTSQTFNRVFAA
jgi:hypothetical protein